MKHRIIASIVLAATVGFFIVGTAFAAPTSTIVQNLIITGVKNAPCLTTDANGLTGSTPCGGATSGTFTNVYATTPLTVTTGTASATLACPTCYTTANASGYTTTTIQSVLNALSAAGLATYNSSTGIFTVSSSTLNLGTASQYNKSDVLSSSTLYVSSFNTRTGAVTLSSGDVTTALGFTPYNSTNPNSYISSSTGATLYYPLSGNPSGFTTNTGTIASIVIGNGLTGSPSTITTTGTIQLNTSTVNALITAFGYITTSTNNFGGVTGAGNGVTNDCTKWVNSSTITDAGSTCGTGGGGIASYNVTSANPFLSVTTTTTSAVITATTTYVQSVNGATGTISNVAKTNVDNAFSTGQTITGNVTTTNLTVSSSLSIDMVTASGTTGYTLSGDGNNFLNINQFGNTPGSGSTGTLQEYNIVEQNCPYATSTSNQAECTYSQSLANPYGLTGRVFYDHTLELYASTYLWGDFITATNSSTLPEFVVEFTDHTNNHAQPFTITPVNSSTNSGFNVAIGNAGSSVNITGGTSITGAASTTGNFAVGASETIASGLTIAGGGANITGNIVATGTLNLYSAGNGAINTFRGSTGNYDTQCLGTGSTAWWCEQLNPNGTNNLTIVDSQDGGAALTANINGSTTIGNSGTGTGIYFATAATASTTLTVNQTTTLPSVATNSVLVTDGSHNVTGVAVLSAANGGTATTTALGSAAFHPSTDFLASSTNLAPSSTIYGAGAYLATSGSNLTVSSTLASTTINLAINNATTTAPSFTKASWDFKLSLSKITCVDEVGTTTLQIYKSSGITSDTLTSQIVASLPCGTAGNSTTTFTTSTLAANEALFINVTSTAGTPTLTTVVINAFKL